VDMKNKIITILTLLILIFEFIIPTPFLVPKSTAGSAVVDAVKGENVRDVAIRRQKNGNDNVNSLINSGTTTSKTGTTSGNETVDQKDEITSSPSMFSAGFSILLVLLSIVPAMISTLLTLIVTGKPFVPLLDNTNVYTIGNLLANKYPLFDVDIFDTKESDGMYSETLSLIKEQISIFYMTVRNLSIMLLVVVLMYIAIRMLIGSASASQTAKLKDMLIGWVRAIFLIFVSLISVFPLYWMAVSATHTSIEVIRGALLPGNYLFKNFAMAFAEKVLPTFSTIYFTQRLNKSKFVMLCRFVISFVITEL